MWQFYHYLCGCLWSEQCGSFNITCAAVCGANSVAVSTLSAQMSVNSVAVSTLSVQMSVNSVAVLPLPVRLSVERTVWQFQHYLRKCL